MLKWVKPLKNHRKYMCHNSCHFSTNKHLLQTFCCCHIFVYFCTVHCIFQGGCWNIYCRMVNIYQRLGLTDSILRTLSPTELNGAIYFLRSICQQLHNMRLHATQNLPPSELRINFAGTEKSMQIKLCSETKCTLINLIIISARSHHFSLLRIKYVFSFNLCCNSGTQS